MSVNPVRAFENEFCRFVGSKHAVAVSNGTAALTVALISTGIKNNRVIITTPFTFPATANAILAVGCKPFFVDIKRNSVLIDERKVEEIIKSRLDITAVIPVHLFGQTANVSYLGELCSKFGVALVEDASQALGAKHRDKFAGTCGS